MCSQFATANTAMCTFPRMPMCSTPQSTFGHRGRRRLINYNTCLFGLPHPASWYALLIMMTSVPCTGPASLPQLGRRFRVGYPVRPQLLFSVAACSKHRRELLGYGPPSCTRMHVLHSLFLFRDSERLRVGVAIDDIGF